jgi:Carboxypeptidase regulatory-like domain
MRTAVVAIAATIALVGIALASGAGPFSDGFAGAPGAPLPFNQSATAGAWDVQVHSRDDTTWYQLQEMQAQHGADCAGPPASHANSSYESSVFQCRDHVMTAINASGYGVIYLTPNQMVDFSGGSATIQWEMSTEAMSKRDWWDVWVTPYADNLALPFDSGDVDLQGVPRNGLHLNSEGSNAGRLGVIRDYGESFSGQAGAPISSGIAAGTNQAATRQTFKLTITSTSARFERLASATATAEVYWTETFANLGWTQGVVQFGHHSYNPTKDGSGVPASWHWDAVSINPATPFTIIKADGRYADSSAPAITFAQAAPANSFLRFSGIGAIDISIDGGPFVRATQQVGSAQGAGHVEHMSNYWHPLPVGARSVRFRFGPDGWYTGPTIAKDFAVFSSSAAGGGGGTSSTTLSGTVTLQARTNHTGVTIAVSPGGMTTQTNSSGAFTLSGLAPGTTYRVMATAPGFVPAARAAFTPVQGANSLPATVLKAGDANGDSSVTISDISAVASDFGSAPVRGTTDFNANGTVDISDVSVAATNFGSAGPSIW